MTYEKFKEEVKKGLRKYLPQEYKDAEINEMRVRKVNHMADVIAIRKRGSDFSLKFHWEKLYARYVDGYSFEDILRHIAQCVDNAEIHGRHVSNFLVLERAKENICWQLINTRLNEELLAQVPHREFEDLSIIYRVEYPDVSAVINNVMVRNYGLDEEALYQLAKHNASRLMKPVVIPLCQICEEYPDADMYVISNDIHIRGASCMLDETVFHELAEGLDSDLYILPSSIDEVIAMPADDMEPDELAKMVWTVNRTTVEPAMRLSDSVYYYSRQTKKVSLAV